MHIKSDEIRNYCIKKIPESFITDINYLKLSDFNTNLFKIDENEEMTYKDTAIDIVNIKSEEIKKYFIDNWLDMCFNVIDYFKLSDFDTTKFIFDKENKTFTYNNFIINISSIRSQEIKEYCIKQMPEYFLNYRYIILKLSYFDTTLFKIDKQNQTLSYKDVTVNIKDIKSEEIKKYCLENLQKAEDKDIVMSIHNNIKIMF
jgi:TolB-like protein